MRGRNSLINSTFTVEFTRSLGFLPRLLCRYCPLRRSSTIIDYRAVNTTASKGALFIVPLLREPHVLLALLQADFLIAADLRDHLHATEHRRGAIDKGRRAIEGIRRNGIVSGSPIGG